MYFEDILTNIKQTTNIYEKERGIQTAQVSLVSGKEEENYAIFIAEKTDNTFTLFFAYKNKRSEPSTWTWFCPSKDHVEGFEKFISIYKRQDKINLDKREIIKYIKKSSKDLGNIDSFFGES